MPAHSGRSQRVSLLDEDPDLCEGLPTAELEAARERALANVVELTPPSCDMDAICSQANPGWLGLFVLDGLLIRRVNIGRRSTCELLGPTDVLRPWDADADYAPLPLSLDWLVVKSTRLALLDGGFMLRIARWPQLTARIVSRLAHRARYQALARTVTHLPRADARLLMLFWLLAERWGTVSTGGVYVNLPLTHDTLAMLVGAHRPTVTIALQRLSRAGFLIRERSDRWLLTRAGIDSLEHADSMRLIGGDTAIGDAAEDPDQDPLAARADDQDDLLLPTPPPTA
ncbi:MAG: helix-turn-helix domain-containing protein [Solirubrobacteraceae bacterium]